MSQIVNDNVIQTRRKSVTVLQVDHGNDLRVKSALIKTEHATLKRPKVELDLLFNESELVFGRAKRFFAPVNYKINISTSNVAAETYKASNTSMRL